MRVTGIITIIIIFGVFATIVGVWSERAESRNYASPRRERRIKRQIDRLYREEEARKRREAERRARAEAKAAKAAAAKIAKQAAQVAKQGPVT
jgi:hypothetical protein